MNITQAQEMIEAANAKEKELWDQLQQIEKEVEPAITRRDQARAAWYAAHQEAGVVIKIKEIVTKETP